MNQYLKYIGVGLLIIFIVWNIIFSILVYSGGGCPPTYVVIASTQSEYNYTPRAGVMHLTQSDVVAHPGLVDAFTNKKAILLPIGTVFDFIPGDFFGPKYARTRVPIWDKGYLENNYGSAWEYNGSYFKLVSTQC